MKSLCHHDRVGLVVAQGTLEQDSVKLLLKLARETVTVYTLRRFTEHNFPTFWCE